MKTIILAALGLSLAACTSFPIAGGRPTAGYPTDERYRAIGTEPFWDLSIGYDLTFTDRGNDVRVVQRTPRPIVGVAGEIYNTPRIRVNIVHSKCSDGMSDRTYPDTVQVTVDGRQFRGCGAAPDFFVSVDERGNPVVAPPPLTLPAPPVERTRWRVAAIDGRATPAAGDYSIAFDSGRISARFGCNRIGGSYAQNRSTLTVTNLLSTKMACPEMGWETRGLAVLGEVLSILPQGPNRLDLTGKAGTITLQRM
jgi:heat shock protein HslJ